MTIDSRQSEGFRNLERPGPTTSSPSFRIGRLLSRVLRLSGLVRFGLRLVSSDCGNSVSNLVPVEMAHVEAIVGDYTTFLDNVFSDLSQLKIDVKHYELDHICYRVVTDEQFEASSMALGKIAELLGTVVLGGRKVSTYKLHEPIVYNNRSIALIELPEFKKSSKNSYPLGLEHVEFAIGAEADLQAFAHDHPHIAFEMDEFKKANNPAIRVMLPNGHGSVKFHHLPLEEVIRREKLAAADHQ